MIRKIRRVNQRATALVLAGVLVMGSVNGPVTAGTGVVVQAADAIAEIKEKYVIASFDADAEGWIAFNGYHYSAGKDDPIVYDGVSIETPEVVYDSLNQRLELKLDYSKDAAYGWSEAKFGTTFDTPLSISGYNCLMYQIRYPEGFSFTTAAFATAGETMVMTGQGSILQEVSNGDGSCSAVAVIDFDSSEAPVTSLILSIVGSYTDFVGSVTVDDITLCKTTKVGEVEITETVKESTDAADLSYMPDRVELADKEAVSSAAALASYLQSLQSSNQVLFGQQSALYQKVRGSADGSSDVKDITGSYPGLMGIDTLAIIGAEMGVSSTEEALRKSIEVSKKASREGLIISLSGHMPNFTSSTIKKTEEGYDFFDCDVNGSSDLSNDVVDQILPGGEYQEVFYAYLDLIAEYALALQEENIPILFRPLHEDNGNWFWWGSTVSAEKYKALYKDMVLYLRDKGVHNMLYVYAPNGPFEREEEYLERYPGDDFIDIVAFDYYDDHCDYTQDLKGTFIERLSTTCAVISNVAKARGKIAAIAETGVRVQRENGSMDGLLVSNNPVTGQSWYETVLRTAAANEMSYFLVWANFSTDNFYVPYKYSDTTGHELTDEFIQFYNNSASIFANGTKFYGEDGAMNKKVTVVGSKEDVPETQPTVTPQPTQAPQATVTPQPTQVPQATVTPTNSIKVTASRASILEGKTSRIKVSGLTKENASKIVYQSSNQEIATVSVDGLVRGKKAGTAAIRAYYKNELVGSVVITVMKAVPVKKIQFTQRVIVMNTGDTYQLRISTQPVKTTDTILYSSSATNVISVSKNGVVKGKKPGKAVITVKTSSGTKVAIPITCL